MTGRKPYHTKLSGMEGKITLFHLLNNAFPDRLGTASFTLSVKFSSTDKKHI